MHDSNKHKHILAQRWKCKWNSAAWCGKIVMHRQRLCPTWFWNFFLPFFEFSNFTNVKLHFLDRRTLELSWNSGFETLLSFSKFVISLKDTGFEILQVLQRFGILQIVPTKNLRILVKKNRPVYVKWGLMSYSKLLLI